MFGALKRGFRSMASLILVSNVVGVLQPKRILAASRGFLAAARLSCYRTPAHLVMSIMRDMVIPSVCRFWSLDTLVGVVAKQLNVSSKFFLPSDSYNFLVSLELNIVTKFVRVFRPASRCV